MGDRDPEELENEIERTREELARTIDALADRVSPSNVVHRTGSRVREEIHQVAVTIGSIVTPGDKDSPLTEEQRRRALIAGGVVVVSAVLLLLNGRRRSRKHNSLLRGLELR
ncbi:MAG: DUF3618 domain-containing protein [Streptosporangiaceae bacterium]